MVDFLTNVVFPVPYLMACFLGPPRNPILGNSHRGTGKASQMVEIKSAFHTTHMLIVDVLALQCLLMSTLVGTLSSVYATAGCNADTAV